MTWLSGWSYRKSHDVNPATGAGTLYQKQITVHYGGMFPFTKYSGNPVLVATESWEGGIIGEVEMLWEDGTFKAWYRANAGYDTAIGYATSPDAIAWTKHESNPIITADSPAYPCVLKVGSTYYLYAVKQTTNNLYRWSSPNGITDWSIDNDGDPVLTYGTGWESAAIANSTVIYDSETSIWKMLYEAYNGSVFKIGYAYSNDGLNWTKSESNPVLPLGSDVQAGNPCLKKVGSTYYVWTGIIKTSVWRIYRYKSTDLITWINEHLEVDLDQGWENTHITDPTICEATDETHMTYLLYNGDQIRQGLAFKDVILGDGDNNDNDDDVYLNGHSRTDFGDVRFTDGDGSTLLDYWMESKVDGNHAVFWVEVAASLESSAQTIYVYYGKSDETTTSNGFNTFIDFDDFKDALIGVDWEYNWDTVDHSITVSEANGKLTFTHTDAKHTRIFFTKNTVRNTPIMVVANIDTQNYASDTKIFGSCVWRAGGDNVWAGSYDYTGFQAAILSNMATWNKTSDTISANTVYQWSCYTDSVSGTKQYRDGVNKVSATEAGAKKTNGKLGIFVWFENTANNQVIDVLWWYARKITAIGVDEPSHGAWGSEEEAPPAGGVLAQVM